MIDAKIITKVSKELNLSKEFTNKVYKAYWRAVKEHIESLPLKENLTDEDFLRLQPNVNIPSIGKLYITLDRYKRINLNCNNKKLYIDATHNKD